MQRVTGVALLAALSMWAGVCPVMTIKARGIVGNVCFELGGHSTPIPGARIELLDRSGNVILTSTAGDNGDFRVDALTKGEYTFRISAAGFHAVEGRFIVKKRRSEQKVNVTLGSDAILPCGGGSVSLK